MKSAPLKDLRGAVTRGVAWMVLARWVVKGLGLVSTVVLARLLMSEDFGLIAMAMIIVGLTQMLFSLGVDTALIQNPNADESHYNTAWTIRLIQNGLVAVVVFATAPLAEMYYSEPRVVQVLQALAISVAISGFSNIGTVAFRKELQFSREFKFQLIGKLVSVIPTIGLALWLRDYWALVFGILIGNVVGVALSYAMHPYRPRLSLVRAKEIWGFAQWLLVVNLGFYIYTKADQFVVGGTIGTAGLGSYSLASELAEIPTTELISPISRVVVPGYAKIKNEPGRLRAAYLNVHGVIAALAYPAAAGLALASPEIVPLLLGERWVHIIPILQILAIYAGLRAVFGNVGNLMIVQGTMKLLALLTWAELGLLVASAVVGGYFGGLVGIAIGKLSVALVMGGVYYAVAASVCGIPVRDTLRTLYRPFIATAIMACTIVYFYPGPAAEHHLVLALVVKVFIGVFSYGSTLMALWFAFGKPDGAESVFVRTIGGRFRGNSVGSEA